MQQHLSVSFVMGERVWVVKSPTLRGVFAVLRAENSVGLIARDRAAEKAAAHAAVQIAILIEMKMSAVPCHSLL